MIRLLDRYVLSIFLPALAVFTLAFMALFLAVDFASKLGRFLELKTVPVLPFIAKYYLLHLPMSMTVLLPTVVLFASIFAVIKLARTNELLPIAASGTSLRRLSLPFVVAAALASLGMAAMDELVLPRIAEEIGLQDEILRKGAVGSLVEDYDGRTHLAGERYDRVRREFRRVLIKRIDEEARTVERVTADRCVWEKDRGPKGRWVAYDGTIERPRDAPVRTNGGRPTAPRVPIGPEGYVVDAPFTPETLRGGVSLTSRLPLAPLRQILEDARKYPHVPSCAMKVHTRLAFPLSPVVLLLLGLPFVMAAHSKSFLKGLFLCFLLSLAYYMIYFVCLDLGNRGTLPAAHAGWGPTAAFGLAGVAAFLRMRT